MGGSVYIVKCADGSYYVGSTSQDVEDRVTAHNMASLPGYTTTRRPVTLVYAFQYYDVREAHAAERRIKGWSRAKKEALIRGDIGELKQLARRPTARGGSWATAASRRSPPHHDESGGVGHYIDAGKKEDSR